MFAISYARCGRGAQASEPRQVRQQCRPSPGGRKSTCAETGDAIQLYWLSGYIFFGSSEGVFERIRSDIEALPARRIAYVILDFGMVTGANSSAIVSLTKLRNYCNQQDITH